MAFRLDYIAKETGQNLVRNPSLGIATVLTVAVSLTLLGVSLFLGRGVDGLNDRFAGDVEFIVWLDASATDEQKQLVQDKLTSSSSISSSRYVNREEVYAEFLDYYKETPAILDVVEPDLVPTYFSVTPILPDLAVVQALGDEYKTLPGVMKVQYAAEAIKKLNDFTRMGKNVTLVVAIFAAASSTLLLYNTIRTAMFARRREIEVMRLVGAANWFIRLPFMLEGLIQGAIGAGISAIAVAFLNRGLGNALSSRDLRLLSDFALERGEIISISIVLLVVGAGLGFISSGVAVARYLKA